MRLHPVLIAEFPSDKVNIQLGQTAPSVLEYRLKIEDQNRRPVKENSQARLMDNKSNFV